MTFVAGYKQSETHKKRISDARKGQNLGMSGGVRVVSGDQKLCPKCGQWKPFSEFHKRSERPIGLKPKCKVCERSIRRKCLRSLKFTEYKNGAKRRGYEFRLTKEEFETFWQVPCSYCGSAIETIGLDRVDPSLGYVLSNVVACCATCNVMKNAFSGSAFIDHCVKVAEVSRRKDT